MKHKLLVSLGRKWLKKYCSVIVTEMAGGCWEEPDVIGWGGPGSYVIECKANRADFLGDIKKRHRTNTKGLGNYRFYLTPPGLLRFEECAERGWGLLESHKSRVHIVSWSRRFSPIEKQGELYIALSIIRRIGQYPIENLSIKAYTYETKCRASVGIENPK